jgi:arginase
MGVAHLLALPGTDPLLNEALGPAPLLRPDEVVLLGDALLEDPADPEWRRAHELALPRIPATDVHRDAEAAARAAREAIEAAGERFVLHFDVDVLGHLHMPLANMPNPDAPPWGLDVEEVVALLRVLTASERFAGLVLTEVNPANAPDASALVDYVRMVVDGVSTAPI